ncbi:Piso0_000138 [Millerozyma farinosa CBS 7064]|uniref:Phospholipid-transporting ATPase n=1 Tax=Pichia sorbitophila (strain ATCC MYA-4447 / BCRC 22081 / CBS 7064 / NBRC 10061 / NRRL Y-12695) TaxID=559304 RepID=G8YUM1_PICSO|nr:Piso0_000138 [Millerozyma farinosa CBS 7064]
MSHNGSPRSNYGNQLEVRQPKRKRGLSLRSQLLSRSILQSSGAAEQKESNGGDTAANDYRNAGAAEHGSGSNGGAPKDGEFTPAPAPQINIDKSFDNETVHEYTPYNTLDLGSNRSMDRLSASSTRSDTSSDFFFKKKRRNESKAWKVLRRLKNRILGINDLKPTGYGRIIPFSVNLSDVNNYFQEDFYHEKSRSLIDERNEEPYCKNIITSSKYSIYSFFPKQLKAQFSKVANCYFMVVAIMQMIPSWSTTGHYTTIIPLLIFMSISMAREAFDDWKRHVHDKEENGKISTIIKEDEELSSFDTHSITTIMTETLPITDSSGNLNSTSSPNDIREEGEQDFSYANKSILKRYNLKEYHSKWKNISVGDIVKINEDEWFPADVILLATSDSSQKSYVETMALDGETNLKPKTPHPELSQRCYRVPTLKRTKCLFTVEDPNIDLYNFEGHFTINDETYSLGPDNVVYRGSILRNTSSVLGLVIFTGEETKIRMNNIKNPRTKAPKLQKNINYIVIFMVCVVILLSAFSTMAQRLYFNEYKEKAWYLYGQDAGVAATLMGFIIMYNTLIPLSLYVTMEIIKVMQLCFLQYDIDMYDPKTNTPADAKTATILEELGQVSYVFSDKTGTLTDNLMIFRKFSVCGISWIHDLDMKLQSSLNDEEDLPDRHADQNPMLSRSISQSGSRHPRPSTTSIVRESMDLRSINSEVTWKSSAQPKKRQHLRNSLHVLKYIQSHPQTLFAKKTIFFLLSIALCNTCLPKKNTDSSSTDNEGSNEDDAGDDADIEFQAASPDELALIQAARDLGFVMINRNNDKLYLKTYPKGFENDPKIDIYEILDVIEFSSARKRMSVVVKFPDGRICIICKGADNVIIEKLKNKEMAKIKSKEISLNSKERKAQEADAVLLTKLSQEMDARKSISTLRKSLHIEGRRDSGVMQSIDNYLMNNDENEIEEIATQSRKSLHLQQAKKYSIDVGGSKEQNGSSAQGESSQRQPDADLMDFIPNDKLLVNEEFLVEKTLEHLEEFSSEGLRTLLYSFRWLNKNDYETWSRQYNEAKISIFERNKKVEEVGAKIEINLELTGAIAIEDKLQEGVSDSIEKLRRAGLKMWMLTGDKRETAINIGYSCRLIKDYSEVIILNIDEGLDSVYHRIDQACKDISAGSVAHCVVVVDGATLGEIENNQDFITLFLNLCVQSDSVICCRASPSQKANMVSSIRKWNKKAVTLAIGDGANDIAMIQSADIGVGITGKEGLQAARAADYAIAQFRFLLKLLLVNGRYNYVRTSKFVLCTFYKELFFYLTQAIYQRNTLFSGSSMYESWSLSMFNTLFTSLPVLCVGMFDKDLKPATLLAVPELYAKGRLYQSFNLKIFVLWMLLAAMQSVGVSFMAYYVWGVTALRDNTTFPLGNVVFTALVVVINAKCELIEMQNRQWLAWAAFIISVGGYGLWNVLIMGLYRSRDSTIFFVAHGLYTFGRDQSWWAILLLLITIPLLFDIFFKVFKFIFSPSDDELFKMFEKDIDMRRYFEEQSYNELHQGWTYPKEDSIWRRKILAAFNFILSKAGIHNSKIDVSDDVELQDSPVHRKRAGTNPNPMELPPDAEPEVVYRGDTETQFGSNEYEILPSGKRVRIKRDNFWSNMGSRIRSRYRDNEETDADVDAIIEERLQGLKNESNG